ncbi:uncharacterized protein Z518_00919 [Rhinocladiella mackenziei CBS 650.93]|uniref:Uncharacterized protein n=1 Tax=Rhinocladiella mackenziei CBS 650.93 TaxID=1442369 RepID=A0A0D2HGN7_9EURO|nr:uncharacterized protein Z518_00919 [Rhinocladiella mackenziei CBS 650.93]KIX09838.1 hypothetical protein Z518_00919 [Rhinocladiella mackenziei CBS 650.93]
MAPKYINKLQGKRVVIVGGTSGIGFATAEAAVEYGAIVVVASSKQENVDKAVERIQQAYPDAGDRIRGKTVDLSADDIEEQIVALFDFATEGGKHKLDHIVDTAGDFWRPTPLSEATRESIVEPMKIRTTGTVMLAKVALKYLATTPESSFTTTGGVMDTKPLPGLSVFAPVGAARKGLTYALALDMKPIRVNCVCPGAVKTEMFDHFGADRLDEILEVFRSKTLLNRVGAPEDLAECYISVMKNNFQTGSLIYAHGGYFLV